jgi:dipeptidyl aminopeptidase/acylaminoacyl peptidase
VQPELDADRVMVDGGSYGGYMVLASMIHFGSQLCCGVERVGISNFVTFLENTSDYRRDNVRIKQLKNKNKK